MANPYAGRGPQNMRGYVGKGSSARDKRIAGMFDTFGNVAPGVGGLIGTGIGTIGGPAGAGLGGLIGGQVGGVVGGMFKDQAAQRMDAEREKELRKMALLEAMANLRGF